MILNSLLGNFLQTQSCHHHLSYKNTFNLFTDSKKKNEQKQNYSMGISIKAAYFINIICFRQMKVNLQKSKITSNHKVNCKVNLCS